MIRALSSTIARLRVSAALDGKAPTAKRRATLVLSILKGERSALAAARKHGLTVAEVEGRRDRFLLGAENALRAPQG